MNSSGTITVDGTAYIYIRTRAYAPVSVYRGENEFLRIGPKDAIVKELNSHKRLLEFAFPIPQILSEGEMDNRYYYIETSLGNTLLSDIFLADTERQGAVADKNFRKLSELVEKFARAQLKTAEQQDVSESFYLGMHMDYLIDELPRLQEKIMAGFEKLKMRTSSLPAVMTHGDFNPHNIFEGGVIDFENMFDAPAGYDIVSNAYHAFLFPKEGDFEATRRYGFSEEQITGYFSLMDTVYIENGLPKLSNFIPDFIFGRTVWSAVRMQRWPKVQQWRYEKFEKILESYLSDDGNVISLVKS